MRCFSKKGILAISVLIALVLVSCTSILYIRNNNSISKAYILAFDRVWDMDKGLSSDVKYVSINTVYFKTLSESEKNKLYKYVEKKYKVTVLEMSKAELVQNGYSGKYGWPEGVLIQFSDYRDYSKVSDFSQTPNSVSFNGEKWRGDAGSLGFSFEAEKKNGIWKVVSCKSTFSS